MWKDPLLFAGQYSSVSYLLAVLFLLTAMFNINHVYMCTVCTKWIAYDGFMAVSSKRQGGRGTFMASRVATGKGLNEMPCSVYFQYLAMKRTRRETSAYSIPQMPQPVFQGLKISKVSPRDIIIKKESLRQLFI